MADYSSLTSGTDGDEKVAAKAAREEEARIAAEADAAYQRRGNVAINPFESTEEAAKRARAEKAHAKAIQEAADADAAVVVDAKPTPVVSLPVQRATFVDQPSRGVPADEFVLPPARQPEAPVEDI